MNYSPHFQIEDGSQITNLLTAFGNDESTTPELGVSNCQDWVAGAISILEDAGVAKPGEGAFLEGYNQ